MTRVQLGRALGGGIVISSSGCPPLSWSAQRVFSGSCRGKYQCALGHAIGQKDRQIDRESLTRRFPLDSPGPSLELRNGSGEKCDDDYGEERSLYPSVRLTDRKSDFE